MKTKNIQKFAEILATFPAIMTDDGTIIPSINDESPDSIVIDLEDERIDSDNFVSFELSKSGDGTIKYDDEIISFSVLNY